ncbi:MAG TPA: ABC transporter substrate-binding protein [Telmatospirillum sp.]|nr:ABC transporter substrate-binding protein [Telmatospirillum sp.]
MRFVKSAFAGLAVLGLLCGHATAAEPVKIGEINSYSAIPAFTVPYRNGWQLAVDEINREGGVLGGRKLEILSRDDGGKPLQAVAMATELINRDGVVMLAGSFLSQIALALADVAKQKKVIFLATEAMNDDLLWTHGNRYTFRLRTSSYMLSSMLAERAAKLPAKRWATVAPDYDAGHSFVANFKTLLKGRRPDVTFVTELWPQLGALDPESTIAALEQAKPDAIFNATFGGDLGKLVHDGNAHGLFNKRSVVSVLTGEPEFLDVLADEAPEGWIVTGYPWYDIKESAHKKFVDAYMTAYNEDPRMSALIGYEAVKAIAAALEKAGGTETEKLVAAFEDLRFPSPIGPLTFRRNDHQATLGSWVGTTSLREGAGVMIDWVYADGAKYLPSAEDVRKWRPPE